MIFEWIARVTNRNRIVVLSVFGLLTAIAAYQGSKLKFEGDVSSLLPPEDTKLYREIVDQVGSHADLIILLEGKAPEDLSIADMNGDGTFDVGDLSELSREIVSGS